MTDKQTQALATQSKFTEFIPLGGQDKLKLSIEMVQRLIAVKTKSGKTCSPDEAAKFIAMCVARRLNPYEGDAFLIGYDNKDGGATFSLITAHQAFLKRAELNAEYDGMKSGIIIERNGEVIDLEGDFFLEGDKLLGGWATVFFKNRKQPMHKRIRLQRFKKPFGIWMEDPAGMICKCAEADALRSSFPTMLGGLYLREEVDHQAQVKASSPIFKGLKPPQTIELPPSESAEPATPPATEPHPSEPTPLQAVNALLKKSKISVETLIEFLGAIGLYDGEESTLESVSDETLGLVIEQWDDFSKRIKEVV